MQFTKMHGLGNDYIYVDCFVERIAEDKLPGLAVKISDRHFGVGSDGLILIMPSDKADFKMRIFNSDGSEGGMCGNGLRCMAKYVYEHGLIDCESITVETKNRIVMARLTVAEAGADVKIQSVEVDMGPPLLDSASIPFVGHFAEKIVDYPLTVNGDLYRITLVSMGNPHCILFVDDVDNLDISRIGSVIEGDPQFPEGTNVGFVKIINRREIKFRVWERGAGITLACGSGACAALTACVLNGLTERKVLVLLPGGELTVEWKASDGHIYMTGPATEVFSGNYCLA